MSAKEGGDKEPQFSREFLIMTQNDVLDVENKSLRFSIGLREFNLYNSVKIRLI